MEEQTKTMPQESQNVALAQKKMVAKNKWAAFLLNLFFGCFGAAKFYEGKIGMGVLYLLTLGIFGIGCVVDFFKYLFCADPYYVEQK